MFRIDKETIQRFDRPGPRYTSYPTVPAWNTSVNDKVYREQLRVFGESEKTLSVYIHLPFCESLCSYCACNVIVRPQADRYADQYIDHLEKEIDMVTEAIGRKPVIQQMHWGGGTPTFLTGAQIQRLYEIVGRKFAITSDAEVAIEIDPRRVDYQKIDLLRNVGFNRVSIGVQDMDEVIMSALNRRQSRTMIEDVYRWCRSLNFSSVNFDLIYGLPGQTVAQFVETVDEVVALGPDRVALYSFAYLPGLKKNQSKVSREGLPDSDAKLDIFLNARDRFIAGNYVPIAMDHFARNEDEMAKAYRKHQLYRNFMGYTVKPADEFIGLGLTSIGFLEKAYIQNCKILPEYYRLIEGGHLPVERGLMLNQDDQIRQYIINELMCHFCVKKKYFKNLFQTEFDEYFEEEQTHLKQCEKDGLLNLSSSEILVTELGKIFIRNVCMGFDAYLKTSNKPATFSRTI